MARSGIQRLGGLALGLSAVIFGIYFLNVLIGGPLGKKPWMTDLWEMLTLFVAVSFFVAGTICREAELESGDAGKASREKG